MTYHYTALTSDDGSVWAEIEELPGCFACGVDLDDLRRSFEEVIPLWLGWLAEQGLATTQTLALV